MMAVEVLDLEQLAGVVGEELGSGCAVSHVYSVEPVTEDPAVAAAAQLIQDRMRADVAQAEAAAMVAAMESSAAQIQALAGGAAPLQETLMPDSGSTIAAVLHAKEARQEALEQLLALEGVERWLVELQMYGQAVPESALAAAIEAQAGVAVTVKGLVKSLLCRGRFKLRVEVGELGKIAGLVGQEVIPGCVLEYVDRAEPVSEDPAVAASASAIQGVMKGKVARAEATAMVAAMEASVSSIQGMTRHAEQHPHQHPST